MSWTDLDLGEVSLLDPELLVLLPVVVLCAWIGARRRAAALPTAAVAPLLHGLPRTLRQRLQGLPRLLWGLAGLLLVVALARPVHREVLPLRAEGLDILLVLDISSSMNARDVDPEGRKRRVEAARERALEFAERRAADRVGLIAFARYPDLRCPPTLDEQALAAFLRPVDTVIPDSAEDLTAIGAALARSTRVLSRGAEGSRVVILLSDGEETLYPRDPEHGIDPLEAAKLAADAGLRVYAIGLGQGRRIGFGMVDEPNFSTLQQITESTDGRFFRARTEQDLAEVYAAIDQLETRELEDPRYRTTDLFALPLTVAGALLALALLVELAWIPEAPGMTELVFERAAWWPLLLAAPMLALLLAWRGGAQRLAPGLGGLRARDGDRPGAPGWRAARVGLAVLLGLAAWLDPRLGEETLPVERRGQDLVICLDTSRSMLARDASPTRLDRARRDIRALLPELAGGDRVSLVAFAGEARLVVPPTHDLDACRQLLEQVDTATVPLGGSDLAAALRRALELVVAGDEATSAVLLLTDGEDLDGEGLVAARELRDRGVVLHTVGYGSTRGSKITLEEDGRESFLVGPDGSEVVSVMDADSLREMAEVGGGGSFVRADTMPLPLVELKRKRLDPRAGKVFEAGEDVVRRPRFQWLLFPALVLMLLEMLVQGAAVGRREESKT